MQLYHYILHNAIKLQLVIKYISSFLLILFHFIKEKIIKQEPCRYCKKEIDTKKRQCPYCGTLNPTVKKKEIIITMAVILVIMYGVSLFMQ